MKNKIEPFERKQPSQTPYSFSYVNGHIFRCKISGLLTTTYMNIAKQCIAISNNLSLSMQKSQETFVRKLQSQNPALFSYSNGHILAICSHFPCENALSFGLSLIVQRSLQIIILASLVISNSAFSIAIDTTYSPYNALECPNRFFVNRSNSKAELSIAGKVATFPVQSYVDINKKQMWLACPLGYGLNPTADQCLLQNTNTFDWESAHSATVNFNNNVVAINNSGWLYKDWRMPNVKELRSLYRHPICASKNGNRADAFNVFNLPPVEGNQIKYWSTSPDTSNNNKAWAVDLRTGTVQPELKTQALRVILIRDIEFKTKQ